MPGQAVETHQKITALARQKNLCSGYPKSGWSLLGKAVAV